jgi:hypothetical protein
MIVGQLGALTKGKTFIVEGQQHVKKNGWGISSPNYNIGRKFGKGKIIKPKFQQILKWVSWPKGVGRK